MAQLIVSAVGAVVGNFLLPGYGAQIGWVAGGLLFAATQSGPKSQGPRLQDLKVSASSYGTPIPYVEAHPRVSGSVIWASAKREIATTTSAGGKGGGGVQSTTYTYEIDVLYLVSANVIAGVRRVWSNGELVYTAASDATSGSLAASATTDKWAQLIAYTGGAAQLPDPTYEAAVGVGNAPAYRTRGTVLIRGLSLGSSGQLPNITFEIGTAFSAGALAAGFNTLDSASNPEWGSMTVDAAGVTIIRVIFTAAYLADVTRYNFDGTVVLLGTYTIGGSGSGAKVESDVPVAVFTPTGSSTNVIVYSASGAQLVNLTMPEAFIGERMRCAYRSGVLVVGQVDTTSKKLYKVAGGVVVATSAVMSAYIQAVCICGDAIYALEFGGATIYKLNSSTLALDGTITPPVAASASMVVLGGSTGVLHLATDAGLWRRDGAAWTPLVGAISPAGVNSQTTFNDLVALSAGALFTARVGVSGTNTIYRVQSTLGLQEVPLDQVVLRQCVRAGLTSGQVDVTALAAKNVRAMAVSQSASARTVIENLAAAYLFESVESDKLKFVLRGGAPVLTIPYANLGANTGTPVEPLPLNRRNDTEAPAQVTVKYMNVSDDYQDGTESSDRLLTTGNGVLQAEVPLGMTPAEAKFMADVQIMDVAAGLIAVGPIALTRDYAALEPTDVVLLIDTDGSVFRARLLKQTQSGGLITFECVLDDATVISSVVGTTLTGYTNSSVVNAPADTVMELMDIAILRDADNDAGFYAAFKGGSTPWPGAALMAGLDGISYIQQDTVTASTAIGTCTTTLANWTGGDVFDETNSVTVSVGAGILVSDTRDNLLTLGNNAALVGSEIIQYKTAALQSTGIYKLSGLLRGRRGSEWAQTGHLAGERFVALQLAGMRRVAVDTSAIGATRHYKGVTLGRALSSATDQPFADTAVGLKPWAGVDLRGSRASGDLTATWSRRTRLATNFSSGVVPLGETTEAYEVEVWNSTFTTLKRTLTGLVTASAAYTSAQQTTDFGSAQATVYLRVYQLSATVGRGYVLQGAV